MIIMVLPSKFIWDLVKWRWTYVHRRAVNFSFLLSGIIDVGCHFYRYYLYVHGRDKTHKIVAFLSLKRYCHNRFCLLVAHFPIHKITDTPTLWYLLSFNLQYSIQIIKKSNFDYSSKVRTRQFCNRSSCCNVMSAALLTEFGQELKGTNFHQKTCEIFHVYCNF